MSDKKNDKQNSGNPALNTVMINATVNEKLKTLTYACSKHNVAVLPLTTSNRFGFAGKQGDIADALAELGYVEGTLAFLADVIPDKEDVDDTIEDCKARGVVATIHMRTWNLRGNLRELISTIVDYWLDSYWLELVNITKKIEQDLKKDNKSDNTSDKTDNKDDKTDNKSDKKYDYSRARDDSPQMRYAAYALSVAKLIYGSRVDFEGPSPFGFNAWNVDAKYEWTIHLQMRKHLSRDVVWTLATYVEKVLGVELEITICEEGDYYGEALVVHMCKKRKHPEEHEKEARLLKEIL